MDTTLSIENVTLYRLIRPQALLSWQRVRLANMRAASGQQWYEYFRQYNAGMSCCIRARLGVERAVIWLGRRTCDQQLAGSNLGLVAAALVASV